MSSKKPAKEVLKKTAMTALRRLKRPNQNQSIPSGSKTSSLAGEKNMGKNQIKPAKEVMRLLQGSALISLRTKLADVCQRIGIQKKNLEIDRTSRERLGLVQRRISIKAAGRGRDLFSH